MTAQRYLTALVVEPHLADALFAISALSAAGYRVTAADFQEAKARLSFSPPHLLVINVRQGEFNGLQLVIRGRSARPGLASLITSRSPDVVLQRDAESVGATFVVLPIERQSLLAAAARTVWRRDREPVRPPFERRVRERRGAQMLLTGSERRHCERRRDWLTVNSAVMPVFRVP